MHPVTSRRGTSPADAPRRTPPLNTRSPPVYIGAPRRRGARPPPCERQYAAPVMDAPRRAQDKDADAAPPPPPADVTPSDGVARAAVRLTVWAYVPAPAPPAAAAAQQLHHGRQRAAVRTATPMVLRRRRSTTPTARGADGGRSRCSQPSPVAGRRAASTPPQRVEDARCVSWRWQSSGWTCRPPRDARGAACACAPRWRVGAAWHGAPPALAPPGGSARTVAASRAAAAAAGAGRHGAPQRRRASGCSGTPMVAACAAAPVRRHTAARRRQRWRQSSRRHRRADMRKQRAPPAPDPGAGRSALAGRRGRSAAAGAAPALPPRARDGAAGPRTAAAPPAAPADDVDVTTTARQSAPTASAAPATCSDAAAPGYRRQVAGMGANAGAPGALLGLSAPARQARCGWGRSSTTGGGLPGGRYAAPAAEHCRSRRVRVYGDSVGAASAAGGPRRQA